MDQTAVSGMDQTAVSEKRLHTADGTSDRLSDTAKHKSADLLLDLVKRSADGGQRKFQEASGPGLRQGKHMAYAGTCGNSGAQCGTTSVQFKQPLFDRVPKVRR